MRLIDYEGSTLVYPGPHPASATDQNGETYSFGMIFGRNIQTYNLSFYVDSKNVFIADYDETVLSCAPLPTPISTHTPSVSPEILNYNLFNMTSDGCYFIEKLYFH